MNEILVTGGTGTLGRGILQRLQQHHQIVRVLSHQDHLQVQQGITVVHGDITTGVGLAMAAAGVTTIIHTASNHQRSGDVDGTRRLLTVAQAAQIKHIVYISIVGIDQHPFRYYRLKKEAETLIQQSGIPWTILRTTQFHGFIWRILAAEDRLPMVLVPRGWQFQSIDEGEVALALADLAIGAPAGRVPDMGGPHIATTTEIATHYLQAMHRHRPIVTLPILGATGRAFRSGLHLAPKQKVGHITWETYLTQRMQKEK